MSATIMTINHASSGSPPNYPNPPSTAQDTTPGPPPYMPEPFSQPVSDGVPRYLGAEVIKDTVPLTLMDYNPEKDVQRIYDATHGAGTNNTKLIKAFAGRTSKQIQVLQVAYKNSTQKDLIERVKDETSKIFQVGMIMLASGAVGGDSYLLQVANKEDKQTKMAILTDIIIGRNREELDILRAYVRSTQLEDLDQLVIDAIQSKRPFVQQLFTQSLRVSAYQGPYDATQDYDTLKQNIGKGANDTVCNAIVPKIIDRPLSHIQQLDYMWRKGNWSMSLADAVDLHFGSRPEAADILCYIIRGADTRGGAYKYGVVRDAERINEAIVAKDHLLITIRLIRAHWDTERFKDILKIVDGLRPKDGKTRQRVLDTVSPIFSRPLHKLLEKVLDTAYTVSR